MDNFNRKRAPWTLLVANNLPLSHPVGYAAPTLANMEVRGRWRCRVVRPLISVSRPIGCARTQQVKYHWKPSAVHCVTRRRPCSTESVHAFHNSSCKITKDECNSFYLHKSSAHYQGSMTLCSEFSSEHFACRVFFFVPLWSRPQHSGALINRNLPQPCTFLLLIPSTDQSLY